MALKLIQTKRFSFIVDTVPDELREKLGFVFGRSIWLRAERVTTPSNPKGTINYSDFFNSVPQQICKVENVVSERALNEDELDIYQRLSSGRKLVKANRDYLQKNFMIDRNNNNEGNNYESKVLF